MRRTKGVRDPWLVDEDGGWMQCSGQRVSYREARRQRGGSAHVYGRTPEEWETRSEEGGEMWDEYVDEVKEDCEGIVRRCHGARGHGFIAPELKGERGRNPKRTAEELVEDPVSMGRMIEESGGGPRSSWMGRACGTRSC